MAAAIRLPSVYLPFTVKPGKRGLFVEVELVNDDGDTALVVVDGAVDVDHAVKCAKDRARQQTGCDTWAMNDWRGL